MRIRRNLAALCWTAAVALLAVGCASASSSVPTATATSPRTSPAASSPAPASSAPTASSSSPAGSALWLQTLQMSTARTGWALYDSGNPSSTKFSPVLLARTTDGARTWTDVTPPAARQMLSTMNATEAVDAADATHAYLAVTSPLLRSPTRLRTTEVFATGDGGQTWTESAPVKAAGDASQLSFTDSTHGWLLVSEGAAMGRNPVRVYRTTDGGTHWSLTAQSPPMDSNSSAGIPVSCDKTGIAFASASAGWLSSVCAVGLSGELLVSHDGGVTWGPQPLPVSASMCGDNGCDLSGPEFTDGAGFVTVGSVAATPELLVSRDLGQSWQSLPLPAGSGAYPQIRFFGPRSGVLVPAGSQASLGAVFYSTSDGGQSWTAVPQGMHFTQLGAAVDFVSPVAGFGWILGGDAPGSSPPPMYATADSGHTWTSFSPRLVS